MPPSNFIEHPLFQYAISIELTIELQNELNFDVRTNPNVEDQVSNVCRTLKFTKPHTHKVKKQVNVSEICISSNFRFYHLQIKLYPH